MGLLRGAFNLELAGQDGAGLSPAGPRLGARDLIWMVVLGSAARLPVSLLDIRNGIDEIVGQLWVPNGEMVSESVDEMLRGEALEAVGPQGDHLRTTAAGRDLLSLLLAQPTGPAGCLLAQVGHRLKMAFLDLLEASDRRFHLASAIRACECEIAECERRGQLCAAHGGAGALWQSYEANRLRGDLAFLMHLSGEPT